MYREPADMRASARRAPDADDVVDDLRERALGLRRWLDRVTFVVGVVAGFGALWLSVRVGERGASRLAYVAASLATIALLRAERDRVVRWDLHRRIAAVVARHGLDGADLEHRVWTSLY